MNDFAHFMSVIYEHMQNEFVVYGFTISFWQIYLFDIVAGILIFIIGEFLDIGD